MLTAVLCEGFGSDRPFLIEAFALLGCAQLPRDPDFPLWRDWTALRAPTGRIVGIHAARSYEDVLRAVRPTARNLAAHGGDRLGVVVDLDDRSLEDRAQAVAKRLEGLPSLPAVQWTVLGVGDPQPIFPIARKNLDQVVAKIVLTVHPEHRDAIDACVRAVPEPTWKVVACVLAERLGKHDSHEAIYRRAVTDAPDVARRILDEIGLLPALHGLIA